MPVSSERMSNDDDDQLQQELYALLDGAVGERVRKGLKRVYAAREQALRREIPRTQPAAEFFRQHTKAYEDKCGALLRRTRSILHEGADRLVDDLFKQAVTDGGATLATGWEGHRSEDDATDIDQNASVRIGTTPAGTTGAAAATPSGLPVRLGQSDPPQTRAAGPSPGFTAVNGSSGSSREWPAEPESASAVGPSTEGPRTALPWGSAAKRPASSGDSEDEMPKRSRRTSYSRTRRHAVASPNQRMPSRQTRDKDGNLWPNQSPIQLRDVKAGECVFQYPDAAPDHFFVLRCNRRQCRPNREQMAHVDGVLVFTAYPFRYKRAEKHFSGNGHRIDGDDQIFCSFARQVLDAEEELNTEANKRGKASRMSMGMDVDKMPVETADATAATSAASPSFRPRRASTSPHRPRQRAAASFNTGSMLGDSAHPPAAEPSHDDTRSRTRSVDEAPPSDPSLLMKFGDEPANNDRGYHGGGGERDLTRAGFAAPEGDANLEDDVHKSPYALSSAWPSPSLEQDAAAALTAVRSHQKQQQEQHAADTATGDATAASTYATRARASLRRAAPEDREDMSDFLETARPRRPGGDE